MERWWWLVLCDMLTGPQCPNIWSNLILDISVKVDFCCFVFCFFVVLGFELRASSFLGRHSTTWASASPVKVCLEWDWHWNRWSLSKANSLSVTWLDFMRSVEGLSRAKTSLTGARRSSLSTPPLGQTLPRSPAFWPTLYLRLTSKPDPIP
jgi:hypothetical protein